MATWQQFIQSLVIIHIIITWALHQASIPNIGLIGDTCIASDPFFSNMCGTSLYDIAIHHLQLVKTDQSNPEDTVPNPHNALFRRSRATQALFDYVNASTRQQHADSITQPSEYYVVCARDFSKGVINSQIMIDRYSNIVAQYLARSGPYNHTAMKSVSIRERITHENHEGPPHMIGQYGVFATVPIAEQLCIGQYFGDEYIYPEFKQMIPWKEYHDKMEHPFRKKYDYVMARGFAEISNTDNLPQMLRKTGEMFVTFDSFFDFGDDENRQKITLEPYVNDARGDLHEPRLSAQDLRRKNIEFLSCTVDDIPMTFLLTTKPIPQHQQLFVYYGPNY